VQPRRSAVPRDQVLAIPGSKSTPDSQAAAPRAPRVAYAVVTWSSLHLVETIHSIPVGARLIVVDNKQLGWSLAKAWNRAVERICIEEGYDAAIILNDDAVLSPATGEALADFLLRGQYAAGIQPEIALLTGYNTRAGGEQGLRYKPGEPDYACFCTSHELFATQGPFDEEFAPAYFEDKDSHYRIRLAGMEAGSYAPYFHYGSDTISTDKERQAEIDRTFPVCRQRFIDKWGGEPGSEVFTEPFGS
jgi:GT2 family glycosyltransferase